MKGKMVVANANQVVQGFSPDPNKCLGTKSANTVFSIGAGGDVDITDWLAIELEPVADGYVTFNNVSGQTRNIRGGSKNVIIVHPNVTQIVPSVACVVCVM